MQSHVEQLEESDALQPFLFLESEGKKHGNIPQRQNGFVGVGIKRHIQKGYRFAQCFPPPYSDKEFGRPPTPLRLGSRYASEHKIDFIYKTYQFDLNYVCKIACELVAQHVWAPRRHDPTLHYLFVVV